MILSGHASQALREVTRKVQASYCSHRLTSWKMLNFNLFKLFCQFICIRSMEISDLIKNLWLKWSTKIKLSLRIFLLRALNSRIKPNAPNCIHNKSKNVPIAHFSKKKKNDYKTITRRLGNVRSHIRFRPRSSTILA